MTDDEEMVVVRLVALDGLARRNGRRGEYHDLADRAWFPATSPAAMRSVVRHGWATLKKGKLRITPKGRRARAKLEKPLEVQK